jgi:hypothetical protein
VTVIRDAGDVWAVEQGWDNGPGHPVQKCELEKGVVHKTLTVVGQEEVDVSSGAVLAWRVDLAADQPGAHTMTVSLAVDSHRALRFDAPSVAGGGAYSLVLQDPTPIRPRR